MDWKAIYRGVRVAVATAAGAFFADLVKQPALLVAAPVISALGKALRGQFPKLWWIPF